MTARVQDSGYTNTAKMANDLSPKKTMLIIVIVVGCFAVLWPKVFYPMLVGSANKHIKPSPIDKTTGCCDVISETDVNTIKIMSEICSTIIQKDEDAPLSGREIITKCRSVVLDTCGIDIAAVLQGQVRLGHTTKQILDQVRSLNGSLCLKYNFGVDPWRLGVPHRVNVKVSPPSIRQERPLHLRSEMVHPAFRERGRAIPQTHSSPPSRPTQPKVLPGRPGPIPAMRPTMGGAGHVVPPPKQSTGTMGLIMPIYTIGIVIFFTYTVMKIVFKKQPEALYPPIIPDPIFRKEVFESTRAHSSSTATRDGKLVVNAMSALLDEVDQEFASRRKATEVTEQDVVANGTVPKQGEDQPSVKVLGMEMTASCEGGKKWSPSGSSVLPTPHHQVVEKVEPPQEIFLEGSLPPQSHHLLVSDSATATETQKNNTEEDPAVVLAGKMTLSVISLDSSENGTEESKGDEQSSSNVSEDFEKIENEQINILREEAQSVALKSNLLDELKREIEEFSLKPTLENESKISQRDEIIKVDNKDELKNIGSEERNPETEEIHENLLSRIDDGELEINEKISEITSQPEENIKDDKKEEIKKIEIGLEEPEIEKIQEDTRRIETDRETLETEENISFDPNENMHIRIDDGELEINEKISEVTCQPEENIKDDKKEETKKIDIGLEEPEIEKIQEGTRRIETDQETLKTEENISFDPNENIDVPITSEEDIFKKLNEAIAGLSRELKSDHSFDPVVDFSPSTKSKRTEKTGEEDKKTEYDVSKIQSSDVTNIDISKQNIERDEKSDELVKNNDNKLSESLGVFSSYPELRHTSDKEIDTTVNSEVAFTEAAASTQKTGVTATHSEGAATTEKVEVKATTDKSDVITHAENVEATATMENAEVTATIEEDDKPDKTEVVDQDIDAVQQPLHVSFETRFDPENINDETEKQVDDNDDEVEYEDESDDDVDGEIGYPQRRADEVVRDNAERINGRADEHSKNGTNNAENELSDDENVENSVEDDEEEIEEIIEYVTDEEDEEEIIEPENRNNINHLNGNPDTS